MSDDLRLALYFGYGTGGHFLFNADRTHSTLTPKLDYPGFPWEIGHLDGGLLQNNGAPDEPDGRVYWTCGRPDLWYAFYWWDRSGDKRPASNSGFYVRGFSLHKPQVQEAFDFACSVWPAVVQRQRFPLQLVVFER